MLQKINTVKNEEDYYISQFFFFFFTFPSYVLAAQGTFVKWVNNIVLKCEDTDRNLDRDLTLFVGMS